MHYKSIFSLNPGKSRSVFLPAISVEGLMIKDAGMLKDKVFSIMEKALIEYKASWIQ
jgi:1-acyl-sn-glycerol-3-phosphate acyltransferase